METNTAIQVVNAIADKLGLVIDWTSENVIPYAMELMSKFIKYEIWTSVAIIISMSLAAIISGILAKVFYPAAKEDEFDFSFVTAKFIICAVFFGGALIACLCQFPAEINDIITAITFPEKIIFDLLAK